MSDRKVFDDIDLLELLDGVVPSSENGGMRRRLVRVDALRPAAASNEAIHLSEDDTRLGWQRSEDSDDLQLEAVLLNRVGLPVLLDELHVLIRSADGELVDFGSHCLDVTFSTSQEVHHTFEFARGALDAFDTLEIWADYEFELRRVVAVGEIDLSACQTDTDAARIALPVRVVNDPGPFAGPAFEVSLTAFCSFGWQPELNVMVELLEQHSSQGQPRDLVIALRDSNGRVVEKDSLTLLRDSTPLPFIGRLSFAIEPDELARVVRVDVAISGTVERHISLGAFETLEPH